MAHLLNLLRSVLALHIELQQWDDAFALKTLHPELDINVYAPYAEWLGCHDQYEKAQLAYKQAGQQDASIRLLKKLLNNAVKEKRFKDASYLCLHLFYEKRKVTNKDSDENEDTRTGHGSLWKQAEMYYAYSLIDQSINEPFRTSSSETLFNVSLFLLGRISKQVLPGISLVNVLVTLAKHGEELGCYKAARSAYKLLQGLKVPASWMDKLDVAALTVRALAAVSDESSPRLECPCCYSCGSPLPVISSLWRDACNLCCQPVIRSFVSFGQLPIVEFFLEEGIAHETARKLLKSRLCNRNSKFNKGSSSDIHWRSLLCPQLLGSSSKQKAGPLCANESTLSNLQTRQVIIEDSLNPEQPRYFYVIDPSFAICQCSCCNQFFEQEEWDVVVLREGSCPFCRGLGSKLLSFV